MKNLLLLLILSILFFSCTKEFKPHYKIIIENNGEVIEDITFNKITSRIKSITNRFEGTNENSQVALYFEEDFDTNKINELVLKNIKLEFWHTYKNTDIGNNLYENLNKVLSDSIYPGAIAKYEEMDSVVKLNLSEEEENFYFRKVNPLSAYLYPNSNAESQWNEGPILGYAKLTDTAQINEYLKKEYIKYLFPNKLEFMWDAKSLGMTNEGIPLYYLYLVKKTKSGRPEIDQNDIISAEPKLEEISENPYISVRFSKKATISWADMTERSSVEQTGIAICINDKVFLAPIAMAKIEGGRAQISGGPFNDDNGIDKARTFATLISISGLPKTLSLKSIEIIDGNAK